MNEMNETFNERYISFVANVADDENGYVPETEHGDSKSDQEALRGNRRDLPVVRPEQRTGGATGSTVPLHRPETPLDDVTSARHTIESRGNPPEF